MDPLTHCLAGGLAAKTVHAPKRRFWIMMFLGAAPDVDVLFNGLGGWAFWLQHRGISHSLIGIVLQAFFYSWILQRWDTGNFRERTAQYALPLSLHVLCDYLTSFGVPLLSPFSYRDFSADLMGGVTLVPAMFMAIGLAWIYVKERGGWPATRPLWVGWAFYLCFSMSGKAYADRLIGSEHAVTLTTLPSILNPFSWTAVYIDNDSHTYHHFSVNLLNAERHDEYVFSMPKNEMPVRVSLQSPEVKHFLEHTRWPVVRTVETENGWKVEWGNLLFSSRGMVRGKVAVFVTADGRVAGAARVFDFWNPVELPDGATPALAHASDSPLSQVQ